MPTSLKAVTHAQNIRYDKAAEALYIIDQSLLPGEEREIRLQTLDEMVENAFNDQCTGANPRYPLMSEIKEIYLKCYYGK